MREVTVAATQMACSWDREANLATAERLVRQAAEMGARIVLVQELFETPYFCQQQKLEYFELATSLDENPAVRHFQGVARELEVEDGHDRAQWERLGRLLSEPDAPLPAGRDRRREALAERNAALVEEIRAGRADEGELRRAVLAHLAATCDEKLEVSRPPRQRGGG